MLLNDSHAPAVNLQRQPMKILNGGMFRVRLIPLAIAAALTFTASCTHPSHPAHTDLPTPPQVSRQQIENAIDRAKQYLYSKEHDGRWETGPPASPNALFAAPNGLIGGNAGGLTALAVHALLVSGEHFDDERLRPAVDALVREPMRMNPYALCQRDEALRYLTRTSLQQSVAHQDGYYLLQSLRTTGDAEGLYWYNPGSGFEYDHSVSHDALLAIWADNEAGVEVPDKYCQTAARAWVHHQYPDGGWSYIYKGLGGTGVPTASMTAAGISALLITQDLSHTSYESDGHGNGGNPAIDRGVQWLSANFPSVFATIPSGACADATYTLYCVELAGLAGGYKYFGSHDWYREGAYWLLTHQNPDGSWGNPHSFIDHNVGNIPATSFALMFLSRGLEPVIFQKVRYNVIADGKRVEGRCNGRPRDIAKITRWVAREFEHNFNWRIVNLQDASQKDLDEAPILFISGDRPLDLAPEDEAKLRRFAEDGGLIMGNPDGRSTAFAESFQRLAHRLFPQYEMRALPEDHPIYTYEQFSRQYARRKLLLGLSNGTRELMVLPNEDFGNAWQGDAFSNQHAFHLVRNLYQYCAWHAESANGVTHNMWADPAIKPTAALNLARLDYGGNADPEPGGWRRVAAILHNERRIELNVQIVHLGDGTLATGGYRMAHLTGTDFIRFTPAQRRDIAKFITGGGVLFIDAAGGSPAFAASVTNELQNIFPAGAAQFAVPIPRNDPFFTETFPFEWNFRRNAWMQNPRPDGPNLHGMQINGKWAVIMSPIDINNGLVGYDVYGVNGVSSDTATAIVVNLVQHVARH
jgi:hypothetical protein